MAEVREEVGSWPGYEPTPLVRLDGRAAAAGIARLWCKHEGPRFDIGSFKPTGPTYAMLTVLRGEIEKAAGVRHAPTRELLDGRYAAAGVTVCAATSGNHGRALAWGARMFGCRCIIYMNDKVSSGREAVIASFGAEVVRVPGSFDRAVQRSFEDAEENGYFVICDRQRRYPEVPLRIIQGYALVGEEIASQLPLPEAPTHVFVPGGSGKLASAVCARLWERYGEAHPRVVTVEPEASACLRESALAGRAVEVGGDASTVMDGLVVGKACANAWTILGTGAFAFMTVEDRAATDAMRQAAEGGGRGPRGRARGHRERRLGRVSGGLERSPSARAAGVGLRQPRGGGGDRRGYRPGGVPRNRRQEPRGGGGSCGRLTAGFSAGV